MLWEGTTIGDATEVSIDILETASSEATTEAAASSPLLRRSSRGQ
jgi:hypothetical protein